MKKLFKFIFLLICISFFNIVKAEEYSTDNNGNYYVKEAVCMYKINDNAYKDYKFEIHFENAKISTIRKYYKNQVDGYTSENVFKNLTYKDFFTNKKFSCFENLYINVYGATETPQGLKIAKMEINAEYQQATWISDESYVTYKKVKEGETEKNKEVLLPCHYTKQTLNSAGSNTQAKAPQSLDYIKYSDGTISLVDSNNKEYNLASGSKTIDKCDIDNNLQMYIEVVNNNYKIVNNCSDNNGNCIIYVLAAYNGEGIGGLKPDGTSASDATLVDPGEIFVPEIKEITSCNELLGDPGTPGSPAYYLVKAFHVIKYVALVLLVVLSVMDFTNAIVKQDKDAMSKVLKKIMMRFILCIIIFLLPYFINLLLKYLVERQTDLCGIN